MIKNVLILISILIIPALAVVLLLSSQNNKEEISVVSPPQNIEESSSSAKQVTKVKLFLVALEDQGKRGKKIGCGDSLVFIEKDIPPTDAPLKAAYEQLLSVKKQNVSNLYNSLYQSNLKVENLVIIADKAIVKLVGTHPLGGICDNPRFEAQLKETALQFPNIKEVTIFINDKSLDEIVSTK